MTTIKRLAIYDSSDEGCTDNGTDRDADARIGAPNVDSLFAGLDQLLQNGQTFNRVVFDTHGGPGTIWFGDGSVTASTWRTRAGGRYRNLFPSFSKMYFSGCNVSDEDSGWSFLEAASSAFFGLGGGVTMGYTSLGLSTRWKAIFPKHLWGELRLVIDQPGTPQRRIAGDDLVSEMMWGNPDPRVLRLLKEVDVL